MSEYRTTIGKLTGDRKVHLAHGTHTQHVLCRNGRAKLATDETIAEIPADPGTDICDVLLATEVKMSHLCGHCFPIGVRVRYKATIRAAIAAVTD